MTDVEACLASLRNDPECGRELTHDQLKTKELYILWKETKPQAAITLWCTELSPQIAVFYADLMNMHTLLKRNADGALTDDSGLRVRVFEYLGKP